MKRVALYAGTRNIYHDMIVSAKSLLFHKGADSIIFLIEDDTFPEYLPPCISCVNVSGQTFFPPGGPNSSSMWTYMVMMRVALTKLFPDLDQILTLDHDTIIRKPIDALWSVDLSGHYFAAVEEKQIRNRPHPYYNFGVLMHNLAKLRADGMDDAIINALNTTHFMYCEQDAANQLCGPSILPLPPEYNAFSFNSPPVPDDKTIIKHYAARNKPLNTFPDYQHFDQLSWEEVLHSDLFVPASGMTRYDIINHFISERGYRYFLEIGTAHGETYRNVTAPVRVSVDPDLHSMATYRMTSDDFFDLSFVYDYPEYNLSFDVIFIDGLHTCDQAYRDVKNALTVLNPGGVIIMHDCLPTSESMQIHSDSYPGGLWTGDVWKAFVKLRTELPYRMYTVNTDFGCGIIDSSAKITDNLNQLERDALKKAISCIPSDMSNMTYSQFVSNRNNWMNIKGGIISD